jgi:hypothetical protein
MKTLKNLRSILSMLGALMICMVVAGLGLYLFTDRGAGSRHAGSSRSTQTTNPLIA